MSKITPGARSRWAETEPICLNAVIDVSSDPSVSHTSAAIAEMEMDRAIGFKIHGIDKLVTRFDCQRVGCLATCSFIYDRQEESVQISELTKRWTEACVEPSP